MPTYMVEKAIARIPDQTPDQDFEPLDLDRGGLRGTSFYTL